MFGRGSRCPMIDTSTLHGPSTPGHLIKGLLHQQFPHSSRSSWLLGTSHQFLTPALHASDRTQTRGQSEVEKMPMERSVSCAERGTFVTAPANDLRCHSASYAASFAPVPQKKMQRAKSTASSWSRAGAPAVQRSGSTKTVSGGAGPTPGLNLRCYSASYAASYNPFTDGGTPQAKGPSTTAAPVWCSAGRRSLNLRSYTPSFAALVDDDVPAPAKAKTVDDAEAELQRKKRLVAYKVYDVEGKVKGSVRRSVKWIKGKCFRAVHGY